MDAASGLATTATLTPSEPDAMHLMYHIDPATGKRVYTLKKVNAATGKATTSAHPGE